MKQDKKKAPSTNLVAEEGQFASAAFKAFTTTRQCHLCCWDGLQNLTQASKLDSLRTPSNTRSREEKTRSIDHIFILSELLFGRFPSASCRYLYGYSRGRIGQSAAQCADYAWLRNIRNGCTLISKCFNHKNNPRVCTSQHYRVDGRDDTRVQVLLPFVLQFGCNGFQRLPFRFTASKIMSGSR